jgi:hypothetical protein
VPVTPASTPGDDDGDGDDASAAACGNGSTSAKGCDCGGTDCCGGESESGNRGGGSGVDIRYSATKMIATPAGQTAKLAGKLKTTGFASPKTRGSEERRACRSSVAAKRARQDNMSEAEKGVGQQRAEAR